MLVKSGFYTRLMNQGACNVIIITFIVKGDSDYDGSDDEDLKTMKDEVVWLHACLKL